MNFENKILSLFDHGRRSAVYVAGYQSARAQAATIAAEADRLIAEMAVENAELRERLSSLESLYRVRDKDCAAKEAERDELREALVAIKARLNGEYDHPALVKQGPLGRFSDDVVRIIDSALASPAAKLVPSETGYACERNLSGKTVGNRCTACMCEEVKAGPRQGDIEDQIKEGE